MFQICDALVGEQRGSERIIEVQGFVIVRATNEKTDDGRDQKDFQRIDDQNGLTEGEHHRRQPFIGTFRTPFHGIENDEERTGQDAQHHH